MATFDVADVAVVDFTWTSRSERELSVPEGALVKVLKIPEGEWILVELIEDKKDSGLGPDVQQKGYVPLNYLGSVVEKAKRDQWAAQGGFLSSSQSVQTYHENDNNTVLTTTSSLGGGAPAAVEPSSSEVHFGVVCQGWCKAGPIKGPRYQCSEEDCLRDKASFDICERCWPHLSEYHDTEHKFYRIVQDIHTGVRCDDCGMDPLLGPRFKCNDCMDYDVCENCFNKEGGRTHDDAHRFCKMALDVPGLTQAKALAWSCDGCGLELKPANKTWYGAAYKSEGPSSDYIPVKGRDFTLGDGVLGTADFTPRYNCTICTEFDFCPSCFAAHKGQGEAKYDYSSQESKHKREHEMVLEQVYEVQDPSQVTGQLSMSMAMDRLFSVFAKRWCLGERTPANAKGGPLGPYRWRTFEEVGERAKKFAAGLRELVDEGTRVGILGPNSEEWICTDYGCILQGLVSVPLHTTANDDEIQMIIEDANVQVVVCCRSQLRLASKACANARTVRHIIVWEPQVRIAAPSNDRSGLRSSSNGVNMRSAASGILSMSSMTQSVVDVMTFQEVEELGATSPLLGKAFASKDETVITIVYTSGSTGRPKGVVLTDVFYRRDVCSNVVYDSVPYAILSFLPLAHSTDRTMCLLALLHGGRVGFHTGDLSQLVSDIQSVRPCTFGSTPRFYHMLHSDYLSRVADLEKAGKSKENAETIAVQEFSLTFGNRNKSVVTGGSSTSPAVMQWMKKVFPDNVHEGYGTTECGNIAVNGVLRTDIKWKIDSVPDMGYFAPTRGELCVITPSMFTQYFNASDKTAEAIDSEGYYHTGDIVWVLPKEHDKSPTKIEIIDRRKNFFKLAQGVFVAPDSLENKFVGNSEVFEQMFIHGVGQCSYLVAVVVPNLALLEQWYRANVLKSESAPLPENWLDSEDCQQHALAEFKRVGREKSMRTFEIPRYVKLEPIRFSIKNRLLTPSEKPCRPKLQQHYAKLLDTMLKPDSENGSQDDDVDLEGADMTERVRFAVLNVLSRVTGTSRTILEKQNSEHSLRLRELCVDSTTAVRVVRRFREHPLELVRVHVPLELIYDPDADLESLVQFIEQGRSGADSNLTGSVKIRTGDQSGESKLVSTVPLTPAEMESAVDGQMDLLKGFIATIPASKRVASSAVFLTGVTGFVGAFLLADLMATAMSLFGAKKIVCLVRGVDEKQATARLQRVLKDLSIDTTQGGDWFNSSRPEVYCEVLAGDLAQPRFGLEEAQFLSLSHGISAVIHCGAYVNTILPYAPLKASNVEGTRTCLELAFASSVSAKSPIGFHFVSTLSVVDAIRDPEEVAQLSSKSCGTGGYEQSKWVADQLVARALGMAGAESISASRGVAIVPSIFRYGNVSPHSLSGAANVVDYQTRFLIGCAQLGLYPKAKSPMTYSPVDLVASFTLTTSSQCQRESTTENYDQNVFHITNPREPVTAEFVGEAISRFGKLSRPVVGVAVGEWIQALRSEEGHGNALEPLLSYFENGSLPHDLPALCQRLMLSPAGAKFGTPDREYFLTVLAWLHQRNEL